MLHMVWAILSNLYKIGGHGVSLYGGILRVHETARKMNQEVMQMASNSRKLATATQ